MQPESESVFTRGLQELPPVLTGSGIAILVATLQFGESEEYDDAG